MSRFVIVGSGAAGIAAIQSIRELDKNSEIVLVMAEKEGYYSRPGLAYYLNKEIPEAQLFPFSKDDFSQMNLKIIFGIVESVLPEKKAISFSDGKTIRYDKLLIAVGAKAVRSSISGTDLDGIIYLDMLSTIKIAIKKAKKAK
ncbi:MAG: NAD(P)/FAD-dependent oxidoreductase, partial [Chloroflexi bacterium]|nr:NAD(P)/FAD-dependent oxidoreductase [Chloroflexota bacterium]